jgi:chromosome segregation ATPase
MPEMFENWQEEVEALKAEIKKYNEIINGLLTQIEVLKKETENLRAELKWERQNHITR